MRRSTVMRLAIISTHPVQYYAPLFGLLARSVEVKVFYTSGDAKHLLFDPKFQTEVTWDIPLLEGYDYMWCPNTSKTPGTHHFNGIVNPSLISDVDTFQPHAVLVYGWAYHSHLRALRYFKGKIPVFFRGDSTLTDGAIFIKRVVRTFFLRWVYRHVDHAFYTGSLNKAYFLRNGLKESCLTFAPHAVDNDRFSRPRSADVVKIRQRLKIGAEAIVILFAGKLEPKKSPFLLLEAFIMAAIPDSHLIFAGSGELADKLQQQALGHAHVHFLSFQNQSQMPALYQACDVFCLPSQGPGETWGLAVNEAMAAGKAVIVADKCGCAPDLVRNGENGYIFRGGDARDLAEILRVTVKDPNLLSDFGHQSKKIISAWDFKRQAEAITGRCRDVLKQMQPYE